MHKLFLNAGFILTFLIHFDEFVRQHYNQNRINNIEKNFNKSKVVHRNVKKSKLCIFLKIPIKTNNFKEAKIEKSYLTEKSGETSKTSQTLAVAV